MLENKTVNNKVWILKSILSAWLILAAGVMLYVMIEHQILPSTFRMGVIMVTAVILVLLIFGLARAHKRWTFATMAVIISIVAAFYTLGAYTVLTTAGGLNKMTTTEPETVSMALVARNDYPDDFADRINTSKIGLALAQDEENIRNFLQELQENNIAPQPVERSSYSEAAQALLSADTDLMVLNEAYRPLIEEVLPQFSTDTKVLEVYHIEAVTEAPPVTEVPSETAANAVNIYLSARPSLPARRHVPDENHNASATHSAIAPQTAGLLRKKCRLWVLRFCQSPVSHCMPAVCLSRFMPSFFSSVSRPTPCRYSDGADP
jgi:hypothetical protein